MSFFDDNQPPPDMAYPGGTPNFDETAAGRNAPRQPVGGGGQQQYSDAAFREILEKYPPTNDGISAAYKEAQQTFGSGFGELLDHPERLDKFRLADGRTFDVVGGAGGPNPTHAWMLEGPGHGGGGGTLGGLTGGANMGAFGPGNAFYDFPLAQGLRTLEHSAAAKGTSLNGGTLKEIMRYGQDYASTGLGNYWDRLYKVSDQGLRAAGGAAGATSSYAGNIADAGNTYGTNAGNLAIGQGNVNAQNALVKGANNAQTIGAIGGAIGSLPWFQPKPQQQPTV